MEDETGTPDNETGLGRVQQRWHWVDAILPSDRGPD